MQADWKVNTAVSVAVCVGAFLLSDWLLGYKWWVDLVIGLAFGGITNLFFLQDRKEDHEVDILPGLSRADFKQALAEGPVWQARIEALARRLQAPHPRTAATVHRIGRTVQAIYLDFREDPADLTTKNAMRFRKSHLERAVGYLEAYARLATAPGLTAAEREKLAGMESGIEAIDGSFTRLLEAFRRRDLDDLAVAGEAMETIFNMDI